MKLTRTKIRSLIKEVLTEMNKRERQFRAAQYAYDNMQHPDFYAEDAPSDSATEDDIFDFAFEELIDYLVEQAIEEEVLNHDESTQIVTDNNGRQIGHYDGTEFEVDDEKALIGILKSNFNSDLFIEEYDEHMIAKLEDEKAQDYADYMSSRYDDYDPY